MPIEEPEVDEYSAEDIRTQVARVLRDLGNPEPPIRLEDVRDLLKLDLSYYSKTDLGLFDEFTHRVKVGGKRLFKKPGRMIEAVQKSGLRALLFQEDRRILIDDNVPLPKHRHIEAHEIVHDITPWHRDFLLGDNELTLNPQCHDIIEAEANYGAGQLLFLMERFAKEARDLELSWDSIQALKKRYGNTLTTTLWHIIKERNPSHPVVGLIGRHPLHPTIGAGPNGEDYRHFIPSHGFKTFFPHITAPDIYQIVASYVDYRRKGPTGEALEPLVDVNGNIWEFRFESFCNSYDLLTFGIAIKRLPAIA
jgi:hypothetical protein